MADEIEHYVVTITTNAKKDLREIIAYIAQDNPTHLLCAQTAIKILEKIESRINALDHLPYRGGYVPELLKKNIKGYRQLLEPPWRIIYKIDKNIVNVLLIIDSRRNTQDILIEKLLK
ncbi:plasmid stabilization protein [Spirochaetia bacterium]|nr:plasmid stabilization protein [Spirochaetia bacterium]